MAGKTGYSSASIAATPLWCGFKIANSVKEPERFLDSLLISGLIEARSHERLGLLALHCSEPDLAKFYRSLMASEARHYGTYWVLADTYFDRELVRQRLDELALVESELLATLHREPRIHS